MGTFIDWLSGKWNEPPSHIDCGCNVCNPEPKMDLTAEAWIAPMPAPYVPPPVEPPVVKPFYLKFGIESENKKKHPYAAPFIEQNYTHYVHEMHKAAARGDVFYGIITTEVEKLNKKSKFVMALDCDGTDEMLAVCHALKSYHKLNYAVIISSPNHYWVVVDKVGEVYELTRLMDVLPGVDANFIDCCKSRDFVVLRAMPKTAMPTFPDNVELKNELVLEWYTKFKEYWQSEDAAHCLRLSQLYKAIKEKKVAEMASSPNFAI